jgi:hypothetical protein
MKNSTLIPVLLACLVTLALINYCLPAEILPKLARLPVLTVEKKSGCDCGPDCCCDPVCKCPLSLDDAIATAKAKDKPLVIYVNTKARPVKDAVLCKVESVPNFNLRVGVMLAVPHDVPNGVEYCEEATFDNTVSEARILESIRDWRNRRARARGFATFPFFRPSPSQTFGVSAPGCVGGS